MKLRKIEAGRYEVVGTRLTIEKGDAPKWGESQEWHVMAPDHEGRQWEWVFTRYSKADCLAVLEQIANELSNVAEAA